jgi:hypothetical protein
MAKRRVRKRRPVYVSAKEFKNLVAVVNELAALVHQRCIDIDIQFKRIAAIQAEIDHLRSDRS